jgi:hypothetical protein
MTAEEKGENLLRILISGIQRKSGSARIRITCGYIDEEAKWGT